MRKLERGGVHGSLARGTLYTKFLPPACHGCLGGKRTNLFVTLRCTRRCFYCFSGKSDNDTTYLHGVTVRAPRDAVKPVRRYGIRSVALMGGEPLVAPERCVGLVRALKAMPERLRVDLTSNGDRATDKVLRELKKAGLDAIRFNLVANGFDMSPVRRAMRHFKEVAIEIPAVPHLMPKLKAMVRGMEKLRVPILHIHELFACKENIEDIRKEGYKVPDWEKKPAAFWLPVRGAEEAALELMLYAQRRAPHVAVQYCCCRTKDMLTARRLRRSDRYSARKK